MYNSIIQPINTELIWLELSQALRDFIKRRVQNEADADDILQDVFYKIHQNIEGLKDKKRFRAWVYQISRNAIIDHYRRRNVWVELLDTLPAEPLPELSVSQELAACLRPMVDQLPDKYREALILTEFEGLTQKEMAEHLGLSISGAKSRVQRARQALKQMMLECCHFEFAHDNSVISYRSKSK
ncbi:MAG: RNA polymerase sigma factor SigZ [Chloroflexota bacterium]